MSAAVVVVGGGPAAVGLLERLAANHAGGELTVHLVDPHPAGAGRVWRAEQSPLMRMNSMAEDVTVFTDGSVTMAGPVRPGPTLAAWAAGAAPGDLDDPSLHPVVAAVRPTDFPDRRVQGEYLRWALRRSVAGAPRGLAVRVHRASVLDAAEGRVTLDDGTALAADVVVLAVGHVDVDPGGEPARLAGHAGRVGAVYVPPAYTADVDWSAVPAGEDVLVRGLGLAFVDLAVLLTEGRGGAFTARPGGGYDYRRSGREPHLLAGSRRGLLHHAKTAYPLQGPRPVLPAVLTAAVTGRLAARGSLDFRADVWPLVAAEIRWAYYHELFAAHPERVRARWEDVEPALRHDTWPGVVEAAVPDPQDRLDLDALDAPLAGLTFTSPAALQEHVLGVTAADVARRSDARFSADLGAFLGVLVGFGQVHRLVQAGAFDPASQLSDVDGWWRGLFNHLASGPPPDRVAQLTALARAGVLTFLGAGLRIDPSPAGFTATTTSLPGRSVTARALVEARLPQPHLGRRPGPLLAALLARGEVSAEHLTGPDGRAHDTGLLRVDADARVLRADGTPRPGWFAVGPLTSARGAAAFSRPHTDAPAFRAADALARTVLGTVGLPVATAADPAA